MSWPIGYWHTRSAMRTSSDGAITADGTPVTEPGGWIEMPLPDEASWPDGPTHYAVRVRLSPDSRGDVFLYAEEVVLDGHEYGGLYALAKQRGDHWLTLPVRGVREAIASRIQAGRASPVARIALTSSRPPHGAPSALERAVTSSELPPPLAAARTATVHSR